VGGEAIVAVAVASEEMMGVLRWWRRRPRTVAVPLRAVVAASPESFATEDNWAGGFYELALEYAGAADDGVDRVALLAQALGLDGC
jgi:hypothetical protein